MKNWIKRFFCKHDEDIYPITKKGRLGGECCIGWTHVCKKCGIEFFSELIPSSYCPLCASEVNGETQLPLVVEKIPQQNDSFFSSFSYKLWGSD
jgi:hypothetical protein